MDKAGLIARDGFAVFEHDPEVAAWVRAACPVAARVTACPDARALHLRHGGTWFVGVDALPNAADGSIDGVRLGGAWRAYVPDMALHAGQLSIIYPGYPKRDPEQSDANHRYRVDRWAAHVDGLLPEGAARRRYAREFHAYILGVPLNEAGAGATVVWPGSHVVIGRALRNAIKGRDIGCVDLTDVYHMARRHVFENASPVSLHVKPGEVFLIHRFALHGTAPWSGPRGPGRMIAFFRPEFPSATEWLG